MNLFTVGYEGQALEDFLQGLRQARVNKVIDVRELPLSRKRGFSKRGLSDALQARGIGYRHVPALGCPKPIRDRYRRDGDWAAYTVDFMAHLGAQSPAIADVADDCMAGTAALLCYEADAARCHRTYVARAVASICGADVLHISAAGIIPDAALREAA